MTFFKTFQTFLRVVHVSHISLNFLSPQDFGYSQRSHFCSRFCFYSRSHCLKTTNMGRPWSAKVTPALNVLLWPWFIPYLRKEGGKVVIIFFSLWKPKSDCSLWHTDHWDTQRQKERHRKEIFQVLLSCHLLSPSIILSIPAMMW